MIVRFASSLGALLAAWAFVLSYDSGSPVPLRKPLAEMPATVGNWQAQENAPLGDDVVGILRLSDYVLRRYVTPQGESLWLYAAYWDTQRRGAQIHSPKHCLPGGGWNPLQADTVEIPTASSRERVVVNRYLMQKDSNYMMVAYWFQAQGRTIASEFDAKLALVQSSITQHRSDAALVRISAMVTDDPEKTWTRLADYIAAAYPKLTEILPE